MSLCYKGHNMDNYHRTDGRCGGCHFDNNKKYRKTEKGAIMNNIREANRRSTLERKLYIVKWYAKRRIAAKLERISELEAELKTELARIR